MTSPQQNPNIGMKVCGHEGCTAIAAVRKNRAGKFYWDCLECGRITPNLPAGQKRLLDAATIWGEQGTPPDHCPEWIAGNWSWQKAIKEGMGANGGAPVITGQKPAPAPAKAPEPAPVKRTRPKLPPPPPPPKKEPEPPAPAAEPKPGGFSFFGENW